MEVICLICCLFSVISCGIALYVWRKMPVNDTKRDDKPFTDDEIDKIKQVVNILSWGGEDEDQN